MSASEGANTQGSIVPKLVQEDSSGSTIESFEPNVVTKLGGTLPWETDSAQLQCGKTVTSNNGDKNLRLNYVSVAPKSEFDSLVRMRQMDGTMKMVSAAYSGPVTFDELKFERIPDSNGFITLEGSRNEPLYEIQLQSKEEDEEDGWF